MQLASTAQHQDVLVLRCRTVVQLQRLKNRPLHRQVHPTNSFLVEVSLVTELTDLESSDMMGANAGKWDGRIQLRELGKTMGRLARHFGPSKDAKE